MEVQTTDSRRSPPSDTYPASAKPKLLRCPVGAGGPKSGSQNGSSSISASAWRLAQAVDELEGAKAAGLSLA